MKSTNIAFFGGTSGLGSKVSKILKEQYQVTDLGSAQVNFTYENAISNFFYTNTDIDNVIIFSNYNHGRFLHKYHSDDLSELNKQIDINIKGVTRVVSHALQHMRKVGSGKIIIASSVLADTPEMGTGIYAACKTYYESLVKTICIENANKGITANCIQMGYMDGGLTDKLPDGFMDEKLKSIPAGRLGTPDEVATTIKFILDTPFVNGTTIKLTGGI